MKKTILTIIMVVLLAGGYASYQWYKNMIKQPSQSATQHTVVQSSVTNTHTNNSGNNAVDKKASPQEQQLEQNLNSLDNGNHN